MKYLKRLFLLQFLFLFIIPVAFAEIIITLPEKDIYNFGEKVVPAVSIKQDNDYNGFFKLYIFCDDYDLQYYTTPLNLEAGLRIQLAVPELPLSESMITKCRLKSNFEATDGENIDTAWSEYFFVTDKVNITTDSNLEAKPGEDIVILGQVKKQSNEIMSIGEAKISFRSKEDKVEVVYGKFEHTIHLEDNVETGNIPILIVVTDKYGNYGDKILNIKVLPIPTRIENKIENNILMPGDVLKARVILYDHNDKAINGTKVNARIFGPDEEIMAEKAIQSLNYLEFKTEKTQMPGNYFLLSAFENIKEQTSFEVEAVRKIRMQQEKNLIYVENIGNVNYKDEVTIILESDDEKYLINKRINLEPGEKLSIDLSKEVPQGTYDIVLPEEAVEDTVKSEDTGDDSDQTEDSTDVAGPVNVIQDVQIDDNRNVIKKTAEGMSSITGAVVGAAGYVASKPTLAAIILVLIILGTVTHYSWGFIKNKVKGKKKESTEDLFEDFKFDDNEKN